MTDREHLSLSGMVVLQWNGQPHGMQVQSGRERLWCWSKRTWNDGVVHCSPGRCLFPPGLSGVVIAVAVGALSHELRRWLLDTTITTAWLPWSPTI